MAGRIAYLGNITTQGLVLDLDAGIKGSYPGSGTTWIDISNNGNNGTLTNGPTFTGSDYGAIVFDGTNDYVDISGSSISSFGTNNFGISTWINFNNLTSTFYRDIIGSSTNSAYLGANKSGWVCSYYSGSGASPQFRFSYQSNNAWIFEQGFSTRVTQSQWYNINYTRNSGTTILYQNGSPVSSSVITASIVSTEPFIRLGGGYGSTSGLLNGSVANTQIYNQALTQFQVWQNFNSYKSRYGIPDIVTDGLILNLDAGNPYSYLSGSSGTTWTNTVAVSSSISGTLTNGPVYSNGAITFDGTNDYINTSIQTLDRPCTFSTWVNLSVITGWQTFFGQDTSTAILRGRYYFQKANVNNEGVIQNKVNFQIVLSDNTIVPVNANNVMTINTWYNYTAVLTTSSISLYENGILQNTVNNTSSFLPANTPITLNSGYYGNALVDFVNGKSSIFQIYNRALSATEVQQNFNALRGRYGI